MPVSKHNRKKKPGKPGYGKNGKIMRKAHELTEERLADIIKACGADEDKRRIVEPFLNEQVPEGDFELDEKLAFIICAMPMVGKMPNDIILHDLKAGPLHVNPDDYAGTHRNMLRRLKSAHPETAKRMAAAMRSHKHVPQRVKSNDDWCCMVALADMVDALPGPWTEDPDPESINTVAKAYINATNEVFDDAY